MSKKTEQTFTKDDFLPTKKVATEHKITFDQALAVMQHMYKTGMKISFSSGRSTVIRPAVTRVFGTSAQTLKLHLLSHTLFRTEYERMKKMGKLPDKPITFSNAKRNAQKALENATAALIKIRQAKGKGNEI